MAIVSPPWMLVPYFVERYSEVASGGVGKQMVPADTSRVLLVLQMGVSTFRFARSQQQIQSLAFTWDGSTQPLLIDFSTWGSAVCGEWWASAPGTFSIYEVCWRPTPPRNK